MTRSKSTELAPVTSTDAGALPPAVFVAAGLMDESLVRNLLERDVASSAAQVVGYRRVETAGSDWAVLQPSAGDSVEGFVLLGLDAEDLRRLDAYRGVGENLYRRVAATARLAEHREPMMVCVYVPTERTLRRLGLR